MKDRFSAYAADYAKFRPQYPAELFNWLFAQVNERENAWDCGTGNGQVAGVLAQHFAKVYATDISAQQLAEAVQRPNIEYSVQAAEATNFPDRFFSLITVAQAIHWFSFDDFYGEVKRLLTKNGIIAVIGYGLIETAEPIRQLIHEFYRNVIGPYWDAERKYIDEQYQTIPFPFEPIVSPSFSIQYHWTFPQLMGYISTWSAVKNYQRKTGTNPLDILSAHIQKNWGKEAKHLFIFPLFLRVGK